jgi:hypothetical protein
MDNNKEKIMRAVNQKLSKNVITLFVFFLKFLVYKFSNIRKWVFFQVSTTQRYRMFIPVLGAKGIRVPFCNPSGVRTVMVANLKEVIQYRFPQFPIGFGKGEEFPKVT